ncbi:hypothetical protein ACSSWA_01000 [Melioribacter sp. Ez-97]|uniref:hypothetical protein n=1 Tax=Melioribacter sp. Ez-97 TaxID=3423434 RepID=UPI003ED863EC
MKRINLILIIMFFITAGVYGQFSRINSTAGSFSRLGFGARGMGMGNAMSSVTEGNLSAYYNPAVSVYQENSLFQASYSVLSLGRSLNFIGFTKKFGLGKTVSSDGREKFRSYAGLSVGLINAGVSGIDVRDDAGEKIKSVSTSENQFFVAVANRFSEKLAVGVSFKFYYYSLYENMSATSVGIDIGAVYSVTKAINMSFVISDLNSSYKWDSSNIYGQNGRNTTDKFPLIKKVGLSYKFDDPDLLLSVEWQGSNANSNILRGGLEYQPVENLYLRGGLDRFELSEDDIPVRPSLGFSYLYGMKNLNLGINYAFVVEPYSTSDQHIIGINLLF